MLCQKLKSYYFRPEQDRIPFQEITRVQGLSCRPWFYPWPAGLSVFHSPRVFLHQPQPSADNGSHHGPKKRICLYIENVAFHQGKPPIPICKMVRKADAPHPQSDERNEEKSCSRHQHSAGCLPSLCQFKRNLTCQV